MRAQTICARRQRVVIILLVAVLLLIVGCGAPQETPVPTTVVPTATAVPTLTHTPPPTQTPTLTPSLTPTPTPTHTPTSTPSPSPEPTATATPLPQASAFITSTVDNGWTLYDLQEGGFAIALPGEWVVIPVTPEGLGDLLARSRERNPAIGNAVSEEAMRTMAAQGILFYALDGSLESLLSDVPASVNVLRVDVGLELPLDIFAGLTLGQLEDLADPDIPVEYQLVRLSNTDAAEFVYTMPIATASGGFSPARLTQYAVLVGTEAYVISLGSTEEVADSYEATFREIGQSFRLLESGDASPAMDLPAWPTRILWPTPPSPPRPGLRFMTGGLPSLARMAC